MRIQILDLARNDLIDGYWFYEEKEVGVGDYFLTNLYADIEFLKFNAGTHNKPYGGLFRSLSKRFPYAIYYSFDGECSRTHAVVDCRRSADWIQTHLGQA